MGTICAPTYANIFMGQFEELHIYPYFRKFSIFYCRFIDDIFFLWNGTESELIKFIHGLNQKHPTIKLEFTTIVTFLDTKVCKNENRTLCTNISKKPSDRRNALDYKSTHTIQSSFAYKTNMF